MVKNTDLHTHSHYSDGQISPKDLVKLAKQRGIKNLALTDHSSVKGVEEAIKQGNKISVDVIPAVEIRAADDTEVLGYFIDYKNKELIKKLNEDNKRLQKSVRELCSKLKKEGYDISFKELQKKYPKAKGNLNTFYILYGLYLKGYGTTMEIRNELAANGNLGIKKRKYTTIIQAIKLIKNAGGVPVLAHPWIGDTKKTFKKMKSYVKAGLKGIEVNNGDRYPFMEKGTAKKIRKIAKKFNLILTSGSDFHGEEIVKLMPGNHNLGKNNCDEKIVEKLRDMSKN